MNSAISPDESRELEIAHCERGVSFFGPNIGNLFAKLAKVMEAVARVPKNGKNAYHGYNYIMETDLTEAIRPKLAEQGVSIVFGGHSVEHHPYQTAKGKHVFLTTVVCQVVIGDSEGNVIITSAAGTGEDESDKGLYKALTGAMKYWLYKSFLVSTGDDPENDAEQKREQRKEERRESRPSAAPKPNGSVGRAGESVASEDQINALIEISDDPRAARVINANGKTIRELIQSYLKKDRPASVADKLIAWAEEEFPKLTPKTMTVSER